MISEKQRDTAKKVDILKKYREPKPKFAGITAPWFVLTAKGQLEAERTAETVKRGGWKVITTLNMDLQKKAEEQVNNGMVQVRRQGGDTAAFVAEDVKTGQVVALVGGSDFNNKEYGQNNYARYRLPPGSSFKPYDYLGLIEHHDNYGAGTVLYDTLGPLEGYPCTNRSRPKNGGNCLQDYDFRTPGPLTLRYALGGSRNIPAVKAMLITGVDKTIETAESLMGDPDAKDNSDKYNCFLDDLLTKEGPCYASSAIGDGAYLRPTDHVHGLATLSRNGVNLPQTFILEIKDAAGKTIDKWQPSAGKQVVRAESAYIVADMMSDPRATYLGSRGKPQRYTNSKGTWEFSVKTGTTNDGKDGWMTGFSTKYAMAFWVGYHNRNRAMTGFMESMTQPVFTGWMTAAHENLTPEKRVKPAGIQTLPAFVVRAHVGLASIEPSPSKDLYPSWYKPKSTSSKRKTIDIISNKLATDCTPERARKEVNEGSAASFSGDTYVTGSTANTNEKDDVHKCSDDPPQITSLSYTSNKINITVAKGSHPLVGNADKGGGKIYLTVDGEIVKTVNMDGDTAYSISYKPTFNGNKTLKATVVDSVLYEDSANTTVNGSSGGGGGGGNSINNFQHNGNSGGNINFSWSSYSGAVSYKLCVYKDDGSGEACKTFVTTSGGIDPPGQASDYEDGDAYVYAYSSVDGTGTLLAQATTKIED